MQRKIKSSVDTKREALRALFKNDKLGKIMRDAYDSPVGSTNRQRAAKLVSIMRKVGVVDGQGGPGVPAVNAPHPIFAQPPRDYSSVVVFNAPPPRVENPGVMDGQGGPGFNPPGQWNPLGTPQSTNPFPAIGPMAMSTPAYIPKTTTPQMPQQSYADYQAANAVNGGAVGPNTFASNLNNPITGVTQPTIANPRSGGGDIAVSPNIPWKNLAVATPVQTMTGSPAAGGSSAQPGGNYGTTPPAGTTGGSTDGSMPTPQQQYTGLAAKAATAVANNQGAGMFAYEQLLRQIPGMENVPADQLPYGAMLTGQYEDLKEALRKEYDLDNLLEAQNAVIGRGVTLEGDLVDYIQKRDEFLNQTNDMIERFKDKLPTIDTSDPINAGNAQSYLDYLYTLRGRQNKRYIDYLDRSVDEYNKQLEAVTGRYETALQLYREDLSDQKELSMAEYEMRYNALSQMYQEIADAPRKQAELDNLLATGYKIRAEAAKDAAASAGGIDWISQKDKYKQYLIAEDSDGNEQVIVEDPLSFFETVNSSGYDYIGAQNNLADTLYLDVKKKAMNGDSTGAIAAANKYIDMMMKYKGQVSDETDKAYADSVINNLSQGLGTAVRSYVTQPDKLSQISNAAKTLAGGTGWFSYKPISREDFVKRFQGTLDKTLLDDMYDIFDASVRRGNDRNQVFPSDPQELANQLANDIGGMKASLALTGSGF